MTQEEKFEEAKRLYETANADQRYVLESLFPELKESNDERISKEIISAIEEDWPGHTDWIAWLEKQAQKPVDKVEPKKLKKTKFKARDRIIGIVSGMQYYITEICDDYYNTESGCIIMFCAQENFELYKQKPSWSEEDESLCMQIEGVLSVCRTKNLLSFDLYKKMCDLLKSLKDRVQPQPKQELSEEDKRKIDRIYFILRQASDTHAFSTSCRLIGDKECIELQDFLKSIALQNTWRPSEEQMNALLYVVRNYTPGVTERIAWESIKTLELMFKDLKKLKGEQL